MKNIKQIKETCLYIRDLESAKNFYHEKIGFDIIHHLPDKHIFFRVGSSVLLCFNPDDSKTKSSPPPHYAEGNQHIAFEVAASEYPEVKKSLASLKIPIIDQVVWRNGQESFYFNDPENNVLEIVPEGVWD